MKIKLEKTKTKISHVQVINVPEAIKTFIITISIIYMISMGAGICMKCTESHKNYFSSAPAAQWK